MHLYEYVLNHSKVNIGSVAVHDMFINFQIHLLTTWIKLLTLYTWVGSPYCDEDVLNLTFALLQTQFKMLQGSNVLGHERPLVIRISFTTCVLGTVCLPLLGLITCVFISSVFHFEDSTGTHCQVKSLFVSLQ